MAFVMLVSSFFRREPASSSEKNVQLLYRSNHRCPVLIPMETDGQKDSSSLVLCSVSL